MRCIITRISDKRVQNTCGSDDWLHGSLTVFTDQTKGYHALHRIIDFPKPKTDAEGLYSTKVLKVFECLQ